MSKERLEEIKGKLNRWQTEEIESTIVDFWPKDIRDVEWLIDQAERLESIIKHRNDILKANEYLNEQNQRYKQALEFYADEEHYKEELISVAQYDADGICISNDEYAPPIIYFDNGEKARKALEQGNDK